MLEYTTEQRHRLTFNMTTKEVGVSVILLAWYSLKKFNFEWTALDGGEVHWWYFINITVFSLKQEIGTSEHHRTAVSQRFEKTKTE